MSAFAYIIEKPDKSLKYGIGVSDPDNFLRSVIYGKLIYLKFFPKPQIRHVEINFQIFARDDEIVKNFDNIYNFFNDICYNSFVREQIRLNEENEEIDKIKYKKKLLSIRPKPKIILIKPKKCSPFDKDDKPKRKFIDEKIEI
uniref:Uncharacterized protein n=1 Tax=viral metagenome TaxID=1070528 RepID=A0A6C0DZ36_9ZZZZ